MSARRRRPPRRGNAAGGAPGRSLVAAAALFAAGAALAREGSRAGLTAISWQRSRPEPPEEGEPPPSPRPLLVRVSGDPGSDDRERFGSVVLGNETIALGTRFCDCVRVGEDLGARWAGIRDVRRETR